MGVALYTWRKGQDVMEEAFGIVSRANSEIDEEKKMRREKIVHARPDRDLHGEIATPGFPTQRLFRKEVGPGAAGSWRT